MQTKPIARWLSLLTVTAVAAAGACDKKPQKLSAAPSPAPQTVTPQTPAPQSDQIARADEFRAAKLGFLQPQADAPADITRFADFDEFAAAFEMGCGTTTITLAPKDGFADFFDVDSFSKVFEAGNCSDIIIMVKPIIIPQNRQNSR